jgi:hypothetical protein
LECAVVTTHNRIAQNLKTLINPQPRLFINDRLF